MYDPKNREIDEHKIYGPFLVTFADGSERQYIETLQRTKYLAALFGGLLNPAVKIETVEEWVERRFSREGRSQHAD